MQQPPQVPGPRPRVGWWRYRALPRLRRWREELRRSREARVMAGLTALTAVALLVLAGLRWYASPGAPRPEPALIPLAADTGAAIENPDSNRSLTREELLWLEGRPADTSPEVLYEDTLRLPRLQLADSLEALAQLPADRISISNAALLFARKFHREFDPQESETKLDEMAREVGLRLSAGMLPSAKVECLLRYLYLRDRFEYEAGTEWFDELLLRGRGEALPLAALVMALGQRLNMPFHAVRTPQGFWLRIPVEGGRTWFINAADGTHTDEEGMRRKLGLAEITARRGHWLAELDLREVTAEFYARQAQRLARQQRTVEAQDMIAGGRVFDPEHPGLKQLQGELLVGTRPQEALPLLQDAANRYGADADIQYMYGRALRAAGKPEEAMPWLEKATARGSDSVAWLERAACRAELKQFALAVADYQKAATLMPGDITVARGLASACTEWGIELQRQRRLVEAEQAFTQALQQYPREVNALLWRAKVRVILNKRADAVQDLKGLLALDPNHAEARELLMRFDRAAATAAP